MIKDFANAIAWCLAGWAVVIAAMYIAYGLTQLLRLL